MNAELLTSSYDYALPKSHIASKPLYPRDSAKLLVYDRAKDKITHTVFSELLKHIPKKCEIFLNDTKVIKARIFGHKKSGGRVEVLLNKPMSNNTYSVMIKGRIKVGTVIEFDKGLTASVLTLSDDGTRIVEFSQHQNSLLFEELILVLEEIGHIPLPPYIQRDDDKQDSIDYQTLFAKHAGAVASPTASLHFTPKLLSALRQQHSTHSLTLHIGAGTFKPVDCNNILEHPMHSEYFSIPQLSAQRLSTEIPILAIGTTVTRTIEHFARVGQLDGECDLFLSPCNPPIRVNHLLTNFHLPKSTLIMLVASFIGREKTMTLYNEAIANDYRFFSYGDAMLII